MLAESYFHTLDPFAIHFTGSWGIRWYGLAYAVGFLLAWWIVRWIARRPWSPIPQDATGDLMFAAIVGVLLGGRLGYAIFYEPHLFVGFSPTAPWWDLLAINKGGMASHGGMIGVIVACWLFGRKRNIPALHILDVGTMACTPGLFLGRIANFINGELHGRPLPLEQQTNPPWWSMKFPQELHEWKAPQLMELRDVVGHIGVPADEWLESLNAIMAEPDHPPRQAMRLINSAINELIAAVQSGNEAVIESLQPLLTAFYPSQILQAITDGPVLLGLLIVLWLRPRKPGVIGSWFLIIYGAMRTFTEVYRQPDEGVALTAGLSRGQLLSVLMMTIGMICLAIALRRKAPKLGGLFARGEPAEHPV